MRDRFVNASGDPQARIAALGAGTFPHVNGPLAEHLQRTGQLLRAWGNRDALCLAGLYHAVYGTAGIRGALVGIDERRTIAAWIGNEAERIAYVYGACDRDRFHPRIGTAAQERFVDRFTQTEYAIAEPLLRDFCELTVANELELARQNAAFLRKHADLRELFDRMQHLVSTACAAALRQQHWGQSNKSTYCSDPKVLIQ
jgi:hypothetical protein